MTTVSKKVLRKELEDKVYQTFWESIVKIKKTDDALLFFADLFTRTELINFTKRLSIVVLLYKEYEWRVICDLLKVSPNTVAKMAVKKHGEGFRLFFKRVDEEQNWQAFWKELGKLYLTITHGDKVARLGEEGVEKVYFPIRKKSLL